MKKVKVRELKSKVRVVREIKRESEGDKEIHELTESEPIVGAFSGGGFRLQEGERGVRVAETSSVARVSREEPMGSAPTAHLYDVGRRMGDDAKSPKYKLAEALHEERIRSVGVGRDFAIGQSSSDYPEANRIESSLRQEDNNKYTAVAESVGGRKTKRYAWDV